MKESSQKEWKIILILDEKLSNRVQCGKGCDKSLERQSSFKRKVMQLTKSLNAFCTTEPKRMCSFFQWL